ncbi:MAG TPA: hypothetical protein VKU90_01960 [Caulobacteraceae bacterium]|nr:hypothetical protein [Caulobacteraceae bacterium]
MAPVRLPAVTMTVAPEEELSGVAGAVVGAAVGDVCARAGALHSPAMVVTAIDTPQRSPRFMI